MSNLMSGRELTATLENIVTAITAATADLTAPARGRVATAIERKMVADGVAPATAASISSELKGALGEIIDAKFRIRNASESAIELVAKAREMAAAARNAGTEEFDL
jgi:hypothetical protein